MAEGKTSPWIIGGIALGAVVVIYILYSEYEASASASSATAASSAATGSEANMVGAINSDIPDQDAQLTPTYPDSATVTASGTVTGTTTAEPTGNPAPVGATPASGGGSGFTTGPNPPGYVTSTPTNLSAAQAAHTVGLTAGIPHLGL
jgi:hypothetical protein